MLWAYNTGMPPAQFDSTVIANNAVRHAAYSRPLRVYYEDTDAGGIVYYANYLKFFERARSDWLRSLGLLHVDLKQRYNAMFVVHQTTLTCHRPALLEDELIIDVAVKSSRRASMQFHQRALRLKQGETTLIAEASITIAYLDCASLRPKPLPNELMRVLQGQSLTNDHSESP